MRRLTTISDAIPADLRTYTWRRWEKLVMAEKPKSPYSFVAFIHAPHLYRIALIEAVGQHAGDRHFYAQIETLRVKKHQLDATRAGAESTPKVGI